jgi:hypothetical protein
MQLSVRDVDEKIFRKFKAKATEEGMPVGKALNMVMDQWVWKNEKRAKLTDFKPINMGKNARKLSEEIDKVVYGD